MRIATALLADGANVREGTVSILSGFINQIQRTEFPSTLEATLVIVIEFEPNSDDYDQDIDLAFRLHDTESGTEVVSNEAELRVEGTNSRRGYVPIMLPLDDLEIPSPGTYLFRIDVGGDHVTFELYADLAE